MTKRAGYEDANQAGLTMHLFDQTNGMLGVDNEAVKSDRAYGARGDLPSVTGLLLNGTN